ncbi:MAG: VWA domain-containing protein [Ruminococcaceae bacterium]|nr:VWA domain-containing protein [Oscillospiraceae bacterium]
MDNNLHELVFIFDQSTEIEKQYTDAQKGFIALIDAQKKAKTNTNVTIDVFGSEYLNVCDGISINDVKFADELFPLSGVCPLTDSAVKAIDDVGIRLNRTYENCRPSKVIVTIVTFGRDNASKKHTYDELAEIIRRQTEVYKWSFFLLTDFSINMEKLNIPEDNTVIVKKNETDGFKKAYEELNEKITALRDKISSENNTQ